MWSSSVLKNQRFLVRKIRDFAVRVLAGLWRRRRARSHGLDTVLVERKEEPGKYTTTHRGVPGTIFDYVKINKNSFLL